ncbi:hypothetical protein L1887_51334 [Cichorium endivia]|nr:hypothetical protein L1887_51334 [Cichorium endivia]
MMVSLADKRAVSATFEQRPRIANPAESQHHATARALAYRSFSRLSFNDTYQPPSPQHCVSSVQPTKQRACPKKADEEARQPLLSNTDRDSQDPAEEQTHVPSGSTELTNKEEDRHWLEELVFKTRRRFFVSVCILLGSLYAVTAILTGRPPWAGLGLADTQFVHDRSRDPNWLPWNRQTGALFDFLGREFDQLAGSKVRGSSQRYPRVASSSHVPVAGRTVLYTGTSKLRPTRGGSDQLFTTPTTEPSAALLLERRSSIVALYHGESSAADSSLLSPARHPQLSEDVSSRLPTAQLLSRDPHSSRSEKALFDEGGSALKGVGRHSAGGLRLQNRDRMLEIDVLTELRDEHELVITLDLERGLIVTSLAHLRESPGSKTQASHGQQQVPFRRIKSLGLDERVG